MVDYNKNIDAIWSWWQNRPTTVPPAATALLDACAIYKASKTGNMLYSGSVEVLISLNDGIITVNSLPDECFCQFNPRYQNFKLVNGTLVIVGHGNGIKEDYKLELS